VGVELPDLHLGRRGDLVRRQVIARRQRERVESDQLVEISRMRAVLAELADDG